MPTTHEKPVIEAAIERLEEPTGPFLKRSVLVNVGMHGKKWQVRFEAKKCHLEHSEGHGPSDWKWAYESIREVE